MSCLFLADFFSGTGLSDQLLCNQKSVKSDSCCYPLPPPPVDAKDDISQLHSEYDVVTHQLLAEQVSPPLP